VTVRDHNSQHQKAESLPLISKAATVTAVEAMDRNRKDEVHKALRRLGREYGFEDVVPERGNIDWEHVFDVAASVDPWIATRIGALHDRYDRSHPALVRIAFETEMPFDFVAGQYVTIKFDGRSRAYSIASSPNSKTTELCVRRVADGKLSPKLCDQLSVGDEIRVRGPNGHLILENRSPRDIAFLATGTGVAPMKSMIDYAFESGWDEYKGDKRNVWLFLGAAWEDDLPYHDDFASLAAEHDNFQYVPCLSREPYIAEWGGETDYIQDVLLKYVEERALADAAFGRHTARLLKQKPAVDIDTKIDPSSLEVYACGINAMVYSLETAARRLGVPERFIHCEGYG